MASSSSSLLYIVTVALLVVLCRAELSTSFYSKTCPGLINTVKTVVESAISDDTRTAGLLLRLHFHDCFVDGCDASILLDDSTNFTGEKTAVPNGNLDRGYEVIDLIKSAVENLCPGVVSCADIATLASRDSVAIVGGPSWAVKLGRRDSRNASQAAVSSSIPGPSFNRSQLIASFNTVGLNTKDMVALSGSHTIGRARCRTFRAHIYDDANIDPSFAALRRADCPRTPGSGDNNPAVLDLQTPTQFDNSYYKNLVARKGLLHSNQELLNVGTTDLLVLAYAASEKLFFDDFVRGMLKMGDIKPLTGSMGEIRKDCRRVNV